MKKQSKHAKGGADRIDRINDMLHRQIAILIQDEFKDPRIGMVTISSVEVSRDLAHAKVFVTVLEDQKVEETLAILNSAAGFFRGEIARGKHLRVTPKLRFIFDDSVMKGARISSLLSLDSDPLDPNAGSATDLSNNDDNLE